MNRPSVISAILTCIAVGVAILGVAASAQTRTESTFNGHRIIIPASSVPQPGRHHTNYFFVDSDVAQPDVPPSGVETPGVRCLHLPVSLGTNRLPRRH